MLNHLKAALYVTIIISRWLAAFLFPSVVVARRAHERGKVVLAMLRYRWSRGKSVTAEQQKVDQIPAAMATNVVLARTSL